MTFALDVPQTERLRLTAEVDSANKEEKDFSNLVATRTHQDAAEGNFSVALASKKGSISSRVLKVQKGGSLSLFARATYDNEKIVKPIDNVPTIVEKASKTALAAGALLAVQDVTIGGETKSKALTLNMLAVFPFVKNLFSKAKSKDNITIPYKPKKPKAYIEIAIYADSLQTELLSAKHLPISDKGEYFWEQLQDSLLIEEDGFAVVSLRNESEKEVLFDELNVTVYGTERAMIIQENHYEPFGMTLKGLDYVLNPAQKNNFLYQSKEKEEDLGLEMYDFHARNYDPQIGRTNQIDPHADSYHPLSAYSWVANNPIRITDPTGKDLVFQNYKDAKKEAEARGENLTRKEFRQMRREVKQAIKNLEKHSSTAKTIINDLREDNNHTHVIKVSNSSKASNISTSDENGNSVVSFALNGKLTLFPNDKEINLMITAAHEFGHSWRGVQGLDYMPKKPQRPSDSKLLSNYFKQTEAYRRELDKLSSEYEFHGTHIENMVRSELQKNYNSNINLRQTYESGNDTPPLYDIKKVNYNYNQIHDIYKYYNVKPLK
jgi:RHS repeat-associated protein